MPSHACSSTPRRPASLTRTRETSSGFSHSSIPTIGGLVDYPHRAELLSAASSPGSLRGLHPSDERLKLGMVQRLLNIRRDHAALFTGGRYTPLEVRGVHAQHVVAFARSTDSAQAIVIAPRIVQGLLGDKHALPDWGDTEIVLPESLQRERYRLILEDSESTIPRVSPALALAPLLTELPLALLLSP